MRASWPGKIVDEPGGIFCGIIANISTRWLQQQLLVSEHTVIGYWEGQQALISAEEAVVLVVHTWTFAPRPFVRPQSPAALLVDLPV